MDIKTYIEIGEKKAGKQIELARILGVRDSTLRLAKTGHAGLPAAICYQLAEYIEEEIGNVVAASNLVTEKDEKRRKVFEDYLKKSGENAAKMMIGGLVISMLTMMPLESTEAKSPANLHYVKLDRRRTFRRKADYIADLIYGLMRNFGSLRLAC